MALLIRLKMALFSRLWTGPFNPTLTTIDILLKSGHMRLVRQDSEWVLHNTRTKDLALLKEMGFAPGMSYKASK